MEENFKLRHPEQVLADAFNKERAILVCGKHNYVAGSNHQKPRLGCKECAQVTLMHILSTRKGDIQENLDQMQAIIHGLCELNAEGKFDYVPIKPEINIQKDAN